MLELIKLNLGPFIGFLFTTATLLFIVWGAHRTERPGALEALQAEAAGEQGAQPPVGAPEAPAGAPAPQEAFLGVAQETPSDSAPGEPNGPSGTPPGRSTEG